MPLPESEEGGPRGAAGPDPFLRRDRPRLLQRRSRPRLPDLPNNRLSPPRILQRLPWHRHRKAASGEVWEEVFWAD